MKVFLFSVDAKSHKVVKVGLRVSMQNLQIAGQCQEFVFQPKYISLESTKLRLFFYVLKYK